MPYTTWENGEAVAYPYEWDSPQDAWEGLVANQSPEEFFTVADDYSPDIEDELRAYLASYRRPGEILADMDDEEASAAAALMARWALANLSAETRAARGY